MNEFTITNDMLYSEIEAGLERIKNGIIEELLLADNTLDDTLDKIQECLIHVDMEKRLYYSWIFEGTVPEDLIYDPEGEDYIPDEEYEEDVELEDEDD